MSEPVSEILVLIDDLEVFRAALNSAYHAQMAMDLWDQYRKLSVRSQTSPMTKALESALERIEAIMPEDEDVAK